MNTCTAQKAISRVSEYEEQKLTYTRLTQVLCALKNTGINPDKADLKDLVRQVEARRN